MSQTDAVVRLVRAVLGDNAVGACLHGSAVLGGLRPHSDVDVLVVVRRSLGRDERRALVDGLLARSGARAYEGPARPVELLVVVADRVRPWRYPPVCDFLYGEWLRDGYERGELPAPEPSPDLAPLLTMARAGDAPLFGPPPTELLDPVPPADLRDAIVAGIPGLMADLDGDTRNVLLTLARIWSTLETGRIRAKDEAADWALARLPAGRRPVLAHARAVYAGDAEEDWAPLLPAVRPHAAYLLERIREAGDGPHREAAADGGLGH
ncbi:aminoglycoside adenylyltransferase family protein [Streptomyces showdoensis]|uniref:Nucleotidyltransferase n=1 Tax=Streptomyces showdoensis TaxID=68268 RepID=A0A2P2GIM4_STREW|nr:aminoglycoside adenylyltransferase family protein [Streptomyces showdoensis]KKZ71364.1 nucleotidyltransferase [Streptomyces showdoensis]